MGMTSPCREHHHRWPSPRCLGSELAIRLAASWSYRTPASGRSSWLQRLRCYADPVSESECFRVPAMHVGPRHGMLAALDLRCFIVDDNKAFLESAATLLEREGMSVVGVASNGEQALKRTQELHPDVLLVDITLGTES